MHRRRANIAAAVVAVALVAGGLVLRSSGAAGASRPRVLPMVKTDTHMPDDGYRHLIVTLAPAADRPISAPVTTAPTAASTGGLGVVVLRPGEDESLLA